MVSHHGGRPLSTRQRQAEIAADQAARALEGGDVPEVDTLHMFQQNVAAAAAALNQGAATGPQPSFTATGGQMTIPNGAAPSQSQPANPDGALGILHHDIDQMGSFLGHAWPIIKRLARSPRLDSLIEAALRAENLGVAAEVFQTVTDGLNSAADRKQAAPAVPPLVTQDPALTQQIPLAADGAPQ